MSKRNKKNHKNRNHNGFQLNEYLMDSLENYNLDIDEQKIAVKAFDKYVELNELINKDFPKNWYIPTEDILGGGTHNRILLREWVFFCIGREFNYIYPTSILLLNAVEKYKQKKMSVNEVVNYVEKNKTLSTTSLLQEINNLL